MKIKARIITSLILVSIVLSSLVSATLSLSTGKLYFNLNPAQQNCQKVKLISSDYSGKITIRDVWTDNVSEMNINKYGLNTDNIGITVSYQKQIDNFKDEKEVEVCLSGYEIGRYRGDLIFTPESNTNVIVEVGTWLFVNVSGAQTGTGQEQQVTISPDNAAAAAAGNQNRQETPQAQDSQEANPTPETETSQSSGLGITGRFISGDVDVKTAGIIIGVIIIILAIGILVYIKRRKRLKLEGYI
jgi:hypothetical protein